MRSLRNKRLSRKNKRHIRKTRKNRKKTIKKQLGGSIENFIRKIQDICKNIDVKVIKQNLRIIKRKHPEHYKLIKSSVLQLKKYIDIGQFLLSTLNKKDIYRLTRIKNDQIYNLFSSYQVGGDMGDWMPMIIIIIGLVFLASKMGYLDMFKGPGMGMGKGKNTTQKNSKGNNSIENSVESSEEAGEVDELGIPEDNQESNTSEGSGNDNQGNGNQGNGNEGNGNEGNGNEGNGNEGNGNEGNKENSKNQQKVVISRIIKSKALT